MKGDFFMKNCKQNNWGYNADEQNAEDNVQETTRPTNVPVLDFGSNDPDTILFDIMERICS